jgi:hypothetical protein
MAKEFGQGLKDHEIKKIKQFGFSFALGMAVLFLISFWRGYPFQLKTVICLLSIYHLAFVLIGYKFLLPTYWIISFVLKQVAGLMTVLIFGAFFYLIFTPISLILRLFQKDIIKNISREPRWIPIPEKMNDPKRVERLF